MGFHFSDLKGGGSTPSRRAIERRMRQLDIRPLDHAAPVVRTGVFAAVGFVGLFLLYGSLAPISSAATATGEVSMKGDKLVVQPRSSGVISKILVREGQEVRAGQPLVTLVNIQSNSALSIAQAHHDSLQATEARLVAERDRSSSVSFPRELRKRAETDANLAAVLVSERALFRRHLQMLRADRSLAAVQLSSARAQQAATVEQLSLINDELGSYRDLYDKGFARKTTVRSLERSAAQLRADRASGHGAVQQAAIQQARTRDAQTFDTDTQLSQTREQLAQLGPQLDVARYTAGQDVLRAPADGRVSGVVNLGRGMVVSGGHSLMELVPRQGGMVIDVQIKPTDIDDVRVGQPATLRFSSVNPHGRTAFPGHVIAVSPDKVDDGGGPYFHGLVALDDVAGAKRDGLTLQPGIPASVNIKTKDRTLFSYLFSPFVDAISRSLRQP